MNSEWILYFDSVYIGLSFQDRLDRLSSGDVEEELRNVEQVLMTARADLARAGDLCRQLCASSKDPAIQFDLKTKISNLDRSVRELQNRVDAKRAELCANQRQGEQFEARLEAVHNWLQERRGALLQGSNDEVDSGRALQVSCGC